MSVETRVFGRMDLKDQKHEEKQLERRCEVGFKS